MTSNQLYSEHEEHTIVKILKRKTEKEEEIQTGEYIISAMTSQERRQKFLFPITEISLQLHQYQAYFLGSDKKIALQSEFKSERSCLHRVVSSGI